MDTTLTPRVHLNLKSLEIVGLLEIVLKDKRETKKVLICVSGQRIVLQTYQKLDRLEIRDYFVKFPNDKRSKRKYVMILIVKRDTVRTRKWEKRRK